MAPNELEPHIVVVADASFSLEEALIVGFEDEKRLEHMDFAPTNTLTPEALEHAYNIFYGSSPLSSPTPSPSSSRPPSPSQSSRTTINSTMPNSKSPSAAPSSSPLLLDALKFVPATLQFVSNPPGPSLVSETTKDLHNAPVHQQDRLGNSSCRLQKEKKKAKRQALRREKQDQKKKKAVTEYEPRPSTVSKYIRPSKSIIAQYSARDIPSGSTGYMAMPDHKSGVYNLDYFVKKKGFRVIEWDGRQVFFSTSIKQSKPHIRTSTPIVDTDGRVIAVLVGRPNVPDWDNVASAAYDALTNAAQHIEFKSKIKNHRRGRFPALNFGISYGGGQTEPGNLTYAKPHYNEQLQGLVDHPAFFRIAGFASAAFATWAPRLFAYYGKGIDDLMDKHPLLDKNFSNSVWASVAFNFGPRTVTAKHRDYANIPFGWCSVTALGQFDPKEGAHMVMWELKLIVQFPSGSTIHLPSAAVSHSNTPIRKGETRASFTQYTAGGLFRWRDHGFQSDENFFKDLTDDEHAAVKMENAKRCKLGLSLFSTLDELRGSPAAAAA